MCKMLLQKIIILHIMSNVNTSTCTWNRKDRPYWIDRYRSQFSVMARVGLSDIGGNLLSLSLPLSYNPVKGGTGLLIALTVIKEIRGCYLSLILWLAYYPKTNGNCFPTWAALIFFLPGRLWLETWGYLEVSTRMFSAPCLSFSSCKGKV